MLPLLPILSWVINLTGAINISLLEAEKLMFENDRVQIVVNEITGKDRICLVNLINSEVFGDDADPPLEFIQEAFYTEDNKTVDNTYSNVEIVKYNEEEYSCIGYSTNASTIIIDIIINQAGLHNLAVIDGENQSETITLKTMQKRTLFYLDQGIGWLYFVLWSVSFYPQVIMNYRRQSVVGFNFDYLGYDLAGFVSFTLYNCLLFWSPAVFAMYQAKNPGAANPIQVNDVFFCLHAIFIQSINLYQCSTYESNAQKMSPFCKGVLALTGVAVLVLSIIVGFNLVEGWNWLTVLTFCSFIKVGSSVIKYMPQVYLNYKRKCTLGFAIDMAILDISGGTSCYLQTIIQYVNANDISMITGNIGKIGIGLVSCFFDVILLVQHFCLYGKNNDTQLEARIEEIEEKSPIVSRNRLESNLSITGSKYGFSPMASAVLFHATKGDVMNSTASFRDVFSPDVTASQAWQSIVESTTGSRPIGSITNSNARMGYAQGRY